MKQKDIATRRRREVETAARQSRGGQEQGPVLQPGNIRYEISEKIQAIKWGGLGLIQQAVQFLGLAEAIDEGVHVFKRHQPYHESDHVLSLIFTVTSGGNRLQDVESRRKNSSYLEALGAEKLPAPSTAGDFLRRFGTDDVVDLMEACNQARLKVWKRQGEKFLERADLDVDGTIAPTTGECKEGMDVSYDGQWGYGPLLISLANSQEVLYAVNRSANRPSHDGAGEWLDRAIKLVRRGGFRQVRLRGDTDFSLTRYFDGWTEQGVEFNFGMDAHQSFVARAEAVGEEKWKALKREKQRARKRRSRRARVKEEVVRRRGFKNLTLEREEITELEYWPGHCHRSYRMIVLRKTILVEEGQRRLLPKIRYFFYVTNIARSRMSAAQVVRENNRRCNQENLIEQLKNGVGAMRMPSDSLVSNWAYLVIAAQAWNVKAWLGLLLPERLQARQLVKMEFRRFLQEIIQLPCQILRSGRRLIYRLLEVNGWGRLLAEGNEWLKHELVT